jgi:DNA-binding SARP family transcriptional activator
VGCCCTLGGRNEVEVSEYRFLVSLRTRENAAMEKTALAAEIHISLLGGFSVTVDGEPVPNRWRLRKAKTLVKLLALAPGHRLHREVVVDRLWPDTEPQVAANNLHQIVHTIRRMMGPESITLSDDVARLCPSGGLSVDVDQFDRAAAVARSSGEITELQAALELWTGPLLPEDQYANWAEDHRERLTEAHAAVSTLLGSKLLAEGEPEAALALLEPLASQRPLDEHLHRVLIEALAKWVAPNDGPSGATRFPRTAVDHGQLRTPARRMQRPRSGGARALS